MEAVTIIDLWGLGHSFYTKVGACIRRFVLSVSVTTKFHEYVIHAVLE